MLKHIYTIAARGLSVDQRTNTVSVYSILERIQAARLPVFFAEINVLSTWLVEPDDKGKAFRARVRLVSPDGKEVFNTEMPFVLPQSDALIHRTMLTAQFYPFVIAGVHVVEVSVCKADGKYPELPDARFPIEIVVAPQNAASPATVAPGPEVQALSKPERAPKPSNG